MNTNSSLDLETDGLYQQMLEASFADWESVKSVRHITGPRAERLMAHILETKRMYWKIIAKACKLLVLTPDWSALFLTELQPI